MREEERITNKNMRLLIIEMPDSLLSGEGKIRKGDRTELTSILRERSIGISFLSICKSPFKAKIVDSPVIDKHTS